MPILNTLPFGASLVVALLPGVDTPVCGLSSLDFVDLWFGTLDKPHELLFVREADG